ncbi:MAG: ornithine carbamoyltransferase [Methanomicrobiales archaeon]|nr:ornithine carbamoyltransferase [Methanomicrobiales archaeon]
MKRNLVSLLDITKEEFFTILELADRLKAERAEGHFPSYLHHQSLGMVFEKSSTRTRISFEVGMHELGGTALVLNPDDMQIGRGESIADTARVMSRFVSAVMIRAFSHKTIEEFARFASIPVINGLSDREHPCQILADVMTICEHFEILEDLKVAWIGDGNNVCHSILFSAIYTGYEVHISCPSEFMPDADVIEIARSRGASIVLCDTPEGAAKDADVVITDTWVSMGDEMEEELRRTIFKSYQINSKLMKLAKPHAIVLHCLPAHRGDEITDEVMDGPQSVVWDEAENRLHVQKALVLWLLDKVA